MQYWKETPRPEGKELTLLDTTEHWNRERILEIKLLKDGEVRFMEKGDEYYWFATSKDEAIALLQEAIEWIKADGR